MAAASENPQSFSTVHSFEQGQRVAAFKLEDLARFVGIRILGSYVLL
jgi:hypothetical protein